MAQNKTMTDIINYGYAYQCKVLYALLTDKSFLVNIIDTLDSKYFESPSAKWVIDYTLEYFKKYHTNPTPEVLAIELKKLKADVLKVAIKTDLREVFNCGIEDIDYVKDSFHQFCRNQKIKEAIYSSADLLHAGDDGNGVWNLITKAVTAGQEKEILHHYERDIEDRYREDSRNAIELPWPALQNITGGVGAGDLVVPVSNPKGGKSWICTAIGGHAVRRGHNVLHYSLELTEDYTGRRYDSYFTGIPVDKLGDNRELVEQTISGLTGMLKIKSYPPGRATISTIEAHIRKLKNQEGFVPDMIIIDYLDKLRNSKDRKDRNEDANDVYTDAKGLAMTLQLPIISPSQANRSGANLDVLRGENLAGTYEKLMLADFCFSISKKSNYFYVLGNRYGDDDVTFKSTFDRKNGHIVIDPTPFDPEVESFQEEKEVKANLKQKFMKSSYT